MNAVARLPGCLPRPTVPPWVTHYHAVPRIAHADPHGPLQRPCGPLPRFNNFAFPSLIMPGFDSRLPCLRF